MLHITKITESANEARRQILNKVMIEELNINDYYQSLIVLSYEFFLNGYVYEGNSFLKEIPLSYWENEFEKALTLPTFRDIVVTIYQCSAFFKATYVASAGAA